MRKDLFRRYLLFSVSIFINALGISVITKAMLGTSAISSVPYVLSCFTPFTMGQYTIAINLLFVVLELLLMPHQDIRDSKFQLAFQVPVGVCFGWFIDLCMNFILQDLAPDLYVAEVITLLTGCFLLATGVSLEVKANVAMVPGECIVRVIALRLRCDFGWVKMVFDITLVTIASALSLLFMSHIEGVREGTVVAALIVGPITHFLQPYWHVMDHWLSPSTVWQQQ